jgi:hypothetical protein
LGSARRNITGSRLLLPLLLGTLFGCAAPKKVEPVWVAPPRVEWNDLSRRPIEPACNEHRILLPANTAGLFPASMAVTRLAVDRSCDEEKRNPVLLTDPRNEFLQWNSALDDKMAVSEVFPIFPRDLGGNPAHPDQIVSAFRALNARLGLIYAVNELSPTETETMGVLYDVRTASPIAVIHARAESLCLTNESGKRSRLDLWRTDSRALARGKFEQSLRACIRGLIAQDRPAELESSEGWMRMTPSRPVEWPPSAR